MSVQPGEGGVAHMPVDISIEIGSICRKLGVEPTNTNRIVLLPKEAIVTVSTYATNDHGQKFVDGNGEVVMNEDLFFDVVT